MTGGVGGARNATVGLAFAHHHVPEIQWVSHLLAGFVGGHPFGPAYLAVAGRETLDFWGPPVVDNCDPRESISKSVCLIAYYIFAAYQGYSGDTLCDGERGGANCAIVLAFGQDNVPGISCRATANPRKHLHRVTSGLKFEREIVSEARSQVPESLVISLD
jgi:hypothetical protein